MQGTHQRHHRRRQHRTLRAAVGIVVLGCLWAPSANAADLVNPDRIAGSEGLQAATPSARAEQRAGVQRSPRMTTDARVAIEDTEVGLHVVATFDARSTARIPTRFGPARTLGDDESTQCIGAWCVRYQNGFDTGTSGGHPIWRHGQAATTKMSGSVPYHTYAHAALTYDDPADEGSGPPGKLYYWNAFDDACANAGQVNGNAVTCLSPWFQASNHDWLNHTTHNNAVSGHEFDYGNNGTNDGTCSGCIDLEYYI